MTTWRVPLADLAYSEGEKQAVLDVLDRGWLTMDGETEQFENEFARFLGSRHAVGLSNATVALHLACLALDIGSGDEVIVPSLSFVATANAVLYTGAEVRFADVISADELTISPEDIQRQVTDRTRAIIVMHYAGFPCRMPEILEIASRHGLAVIEDAAHAPGASLHGRALGTWGDAGCFSFFSNKNLATGEGGMLVTDRDDIAEKARLLRSHAMTSLTWDRHQGHAYSYDVVGLGYNYRTDEIRASLGRVQLTRLPANNEKRAQITTRYWRELAGSGLGLPFKQIAGDAHIRPAYHIMPVMLPAGIDRQAFIDQLRQAGIQTSIHYPPIHRFSYHRQRYPGSELPQTELAASREVTLPLFPGMLEAQFDLVIESVSNALDSQGK